MPTRLAYQRLGSVDFLTSTTGWAIGDNANLKGAFAGDSDTVTAPLFTSDGGKTWAAVVHTVD